MKFKLSIVEHNKSRTTSITPIIENEVKRMRDEGRRPLNENRSFLNVIWIIDVHFIFSRYTHIINTYDWMEERVFMDNRLA